MSTSLAGADGQEISLSNISSLLRTRSTSLTNAARRRIGDIRSITGASRILAMNALIEAARAGESGRGFSAVANEVRDIATQIEQLAAGLEGEIGSEVDGLVSVCDQASQAVQNERLVDLACNAIEIIDRNLYERTCDVRWWATDWPIATCAAEPTEERITYAQDRLALILKAYTVYLDLWIVGLDGTVIANGRPDRYAVRGQSVRNEKWFAEATRLPNGSCFSVADIATSPMLAGAQVATYCASIRENGAENGKPIGVLAIHFDWEPQARAIVDGVRLSPDERKRTRVMLLDATNRIIASSDGQGVLRDRFPVQTKGEKSGVYTNASGTTVAFHVTPGYETYKGLGWLGVIAQQAAD